jgi:ATP-binding cassette subfamily B protein
MASGAARAAEDAIGALWRLMRVRRIEVSRQQLREACGGVASISAFADELRSRGCPARVVTARQQDIEHLELPTLIMLAGGSAALLVRVNRRSVVLELADGRRVDVPREQLPSVTSGEALDLSLKLSRRSTYFGRLVSALGEKPAPLVMLALASLLMQAANLGVPLLLATAIDTALPNGASHTLAAIALGMLCAAGLQAWLGWFRERALQYLNTRAMNALGQGLLEHIVRLPLAYFQKTTVGDSMQAMVAGDQIARLTTDLLLVPFLDGIMALVSLVALIALLPAAGGLVLRVSVVTIVGALILGRREATLQDEELAAQAKQSGYLVELLSGAATLKAAGAEQRAVGEWRGRLSIERWANLRRQRLGLVLELGSELLRYGLFATLLVWGGQLALDRTLSVGVLVAVLQLAQSLSESSHRFAEVCARAWVLRSHSRILREVLEQPALPALRALRGRPASASQGDAIELRDVWFRHRPELPWVVRGFELRVRAGEEYKLVGPSGMGKTTLLRLMAGLYLPERGSVLVHGADAAAARRSVAYVPQQMYLFAGSILENLRVLSGNASRARLIEAAKRTGLDGFVRTLGMEYETLLPPGGYNLSGGQRQLIVLSACVASERPVLLLDEAMSHLDRVTQASLRQAALFQGKTLVTVVHEIAPGAESD